MSGTRPPLSSERGAPRLLPCPLRALTSALFALALLMALSVPDAAAATSGPAWAAKSFATPSDFTVAENAYCLREEGCDSYIVTFTNVGTGPTTSPVVMRDLLPTGVKSAGLTGHLSSKYDAEWELEHHARNRLEGDCRTQARVLTCEYDGEVPPAAVIGLRVEVLASAGTGQLSNHVEVEGGGAPRASATATNSLNSPPAGFGIEQFSVGALDPHGAGDTRAGGHPTTSTTSLNWTTRFDEAEGPDGDFYDSSVQEPKTEIVDLPPGFVGDAQTLERCPLSQVPETEENRDKCPAGSLLGYVMVEYDGGSIKPEPVYNVPPEAGYPAEFAFEFLGATVTLLPRLLPVNGGYGLSVSVPYLPRGGGRADFEITGARVDLFGDPSESDGTGGGEAFFRNPTDCSAAPLKARLELDSWVEPENWQTSESTMFEASPTQAVSGCSALQFHPSIEVTPETTETDTPSGYEIDVRVPQAPNVPGDLATPDLKNAVVTLPEGVSVDPSAANGLAACQESGPEGIELGAHDQIDADRLAREGHIQEGEEMGPDGLVHPAPGHCPAASQIGEVEVITPVLSEPLKGHVYVAAPQCGDAGQPQCTPQSAEDGQLFGIYLEVAGSGIVVKLKGQVSVNPQTGRVTTRFTETPQVPFSELKLKLNGGPRAPLANPQTCQPAQTTADFTPWSTPYTPDATPGSSFNVTGCTGAFSPSLIAHTSSTAAGAYSPFTLSFSRKDGEQDLSGLTVNMPQGLIGRIAGIPECGEGEVRAAEANTGGCPAASRVGTATAAAGAGPTPFYQSGGVYLTGPYDGAPFGLAVVVPANAGPFHLGNIVVRAAIHIDPQTAQVTVVSDPLPQMIDGVPLRVQSVAVTVGGEGTPFTFNPTDCAAEAIGASITSAQGATADLSRPFAATGCSKLPFKPSFTVSTQGATSKSNGASLDVRIAPPHEGPQSSSSGGTTGSASGTSGTSGSASGSSAQTEESNIARVKVDLPKQLPSRLTTLQKACTAVVFDANPAACPAASIVASAKAITPILPVPLEGPAYFVSHGNEAFPQLILVLQGYGITIDLVGDTFISKAGITSSTFAHVPDAPVSSFELTLPQGKYSALAANANLCTVKGGLKMPTEFVAQNGAVIHQSTPITVTGCPKAKTAAQLRAQKLAAALKACHKKHGSKRSGCEKTARKKFKKK